jgi:hypothetical protein
MLELHSNASGSCGMRESAGRGTMILFLTAFLAGLIWADTPTALAGHESETSCSYNKMAAGANENPLTTGRDGVRADIRVIDPDPNVIDGEVRSIYLVEGDIDAMEFGWTWAVDTRINGCCQNAPTVFAVKVYNGSFSYWEGGSNPGAGALPQSSTHTFRIKHDPDNNDLARFEFWRDGLSFGHFNSLRMQNGGFVRSTAEGFSRYCEDLQAHFLNLQKQTLPSGTWTDWNGIDKAGDVGTKWWYFDKNQGSGPDAPEWWLKECFFANCSDV